MYLFIFNVVVVFLFSYMSGSIPFGLLIGKFNGIDIRKYGSHNIGATNVRRVLGRDWSFVCFALDFLKGLFPVLVIELKFSGVCWGWEMIIAAIGAVCGHIFPVWLRFKGGKGVATSLGVVAGIAFLPVVVGGAVWLLVFMKSRIVSLASISAVVALSIAAFVMKLAHLSDVSWPSVGLLVLIAFLVIIRHYENIIRLYMGTENAFAKPKSEKREEGVK